MRTIVLLSAIALFGCQESRDPLPTGKPLTEREVRFAMDWCKDSGGLMTVSRKGNTELALMECHNGARVTF